MEDMVLERVAHLECLPGGRYHFRPRPKVNEHGHGLVLDLRDDSHESHVYFICYKGL